MVRAEDLPDTLPVWSDDPNEPSAGRIMRLGRQASYDAVRLGQIPVLRFGASGRLLRVPTRALLAMLDGSESQDVAAASAGVFGSSSAEAASRVEPS